MNWPHWFLSLYSGNISWLDQVIKENYSPHDQKTKVTSMRLYLWNVLPPPHSAPWSQAFATWVLEGLSRSKTQQKVRQNLSWFGVVWLSSAVFVAHLAQHCKHFSSSVILHRCLDYCFYAVCIEQSLSSCLGQGGHSVDICWMKEEGKKSQFSLW